jgi:hypothetical protein
VGRLAEIFWEESLPAFLAAYAPGSRVAVRPANIAANSSLSVHA